MILLRSREFYAAHGDFLRDYLRDPTVKEFCMTYHDLYSGNMQVFRQYADQSNRPLPSVSLANYQFLEVHTRELVDDGAVSLRQLWAVMLPPEVLNNILDTIPPREDTLHSGSVL